jgi:hypothetical protein
MKGHLTYIRSIIVMAMIITRSIPLFLLAIQLSRSAIQVEGFQHHVLCHKTSLSFLASVKSGDDGGSARGASQSARTPTQSEGGVEEYRNAVTKVLSNFMQKDKMDPDHDRTPQSAVDFQAPKISPSTPLDTLVAALDYELTEKEWFVTGNVNPSYFSTDFKFQDPDVKVGSIEEYSKGVSKLFDQATSRAEIISTVVNDDLSTPEKPVITVTWRLSGGVNILNGLQIKPYIVYTDFVLDPNTKLIVFQEDRFDIPPWDILLRYVYY